MRYTIRKNDNGWELVDGAGNVVKAFAGDEVSAYYEAVAHLGTLVAADRLATGGAATQVDAMGAPGGDGLLPETWTSDGTPGGGIAFQETLPGGRDFTECEWTWRDPATSLVPLMLQTENEGGHWGSELAGFVEAFTLALGTVGASGRFYDNDAGAQFRDLLLDGRIFGVSVDPSEAIQVEFECTEMDEYGWCMMGVDKFLAYEIAGLTGVPFPGFATAAVRLADTEAPAAAASADTTPAGTGSPVPVRASVSVPVAPPRAWFELPEPQIGVPFLGGELGDEFLVSQGSAGDLACPFTILDSGQVFAHLSYWGQCHVGEPWGPGRCASVAPSSNDYADFHKGGHVITAEGDDLPTGLLHVGCEHSQAMDVDRVRDDTAHAGLAFAQVRVVDGEYGPWMRGALLPTVTDRQVVTLRALTLSGDWVPELGAIIAVNEGGLPQRRKARIAASSGGELTVADQVLKASSKNGQLTKLVGGNVVHHCPECERRRAQAAGGRQAQGPDPRIGQVLDGLAVLERRTRHLLPDAAAALRTRIRR